MVTRPSTILKPSWFVFGFWGWFFRLFRLLIILIALLPWLVISRTVYCRPIDFLIWKNNTSVISLRGEIKPHLDQGNHPTQYHRQTYHQSSGVKALCSAESHYYETMSCSSSAFLSMQLRASFLDKMERRILGCRVSVLQISAFQLSIVRGYLSSLFGSRRGLTNVVTHCIACNALLRAVQVCT